MRQRLKNPVFWVSFGFLLVCGAIAGGALVLEWKVKQAPLPKLFLPPEAAPVGISCQRSGWEDYSLLERLGPLPVFEGLKPEGVSPAAVHRLALAPGEVDQMLAQARRLVNEGKAKERARLLEQESARLLLDYTAKSRRLAQGVSRKEEEMDKTLAPLQRERARVARRLEILDEAIGKTRWFRETERGKKTGLEQVREELKESLKGLEIRLRKGQEGNQQALFAYEEKAYKELKKSYNRDLEALKKKFRVTREDVAMFPKTKSLKLTEALFKAFGEVREEDTPVMMRDTSKPSRLMAGRPVSLPVWRVGLETRFVRCLYGWEKQKKEAQP